MTKELVNRGNKVLSPVLGHFTELEVERAKGSYLYAYNGKKYLDFGAGIAVNATGHCHPKVVTAIKEQAETLIHGCAGVVYYETNIKLAEKITQINNGNLDSIFFTQSGTEAVEAAIKLAQYTQKKKDIIAFSGGFHGRTLGSLSVTSKKAYKEGYAMPSNTVHEFPYPYFFQNDAPYNKLSSYLLEKFLQLMYQYDC